MSRSNTFLGLALAASTTLGFACSATAQQVTMQRLLNSKSEPQNWLMVYGDYSSHNSSGLTQINRTNVKDLKLKFIVSLMNYDLGGARGAPATQQTPLVNNGYLYVNTGTARVFKIDVRSGSRGDVLWVNDPKADTGGWSARLRGIALYDNNVYTPTSGAQLIAIDTNSGQTVWEKNAKAPPPEAQNQGITAAPLAVKDKIIVGHATGSGDGHRAWLAAFDAKTGDQKWRFFMVPGPGEFGHDTWKDNHNAYLTGGAAIWSTPSFDPETNIVMVGTGDPAPWSAPEFRPGDNLFSASTVALDVDTGKLKWFFQEIPGETWDMDTINPRMLYDVMVDGRPRKVAGNFSRNGHYYTVDRTTGDFIFGKPYQEVTWTKGLDPKTGKPIEYNPATPLQDYGGKAQRYGDLTRGRDICPQHGGQPTYWPPHYDAKRMIAYQQSVLGCADYQRSAPLPDAAQNWVGKSVGFGTGRTPSRGAYLGAVTAVDVRDGKVVNRYVQTDQIASGVLGTAGDLLFFGHADGKFAAYDKDTLAELWSFEGVGSGIRAAAITYSAAGKQYVAVVAGTGNNERNIQPNQMLVVFGL